MKLSVSKDQLIAMVANYLCEQSAGMLLDAKIETIEAVDQAGRPFPLQNINVTLAPNERPVPKPIEYQTATGRTMRLATFEGERV